MFSIFGLFISFTIAILKGMRFKKCNDIVLLGNVQKKVKAIN